MLTVDIETSNEKLTLAERINQKFDKKQRVYRKGNYSFRIFFPSLEFGWEFFFLFQYLAVNIHENEPVKKPKEKKAVLDVHESRKKRLQNKTSHVANLLAFLTISFLFTTVPYSTFYAMGLNNIVSDQNLKNIVVGILTVLQYTRHSANFLIYLFTSTIIKREIRKIIVEIKKIIIPKI